MARIIIVISTLGIIIAIITALGFPPISADIYSAISTGTGYVWAFNQVIPVDTLFEYALYAVLIELSVFLMNLILMIYELITGHSTPRIGQPKDGGGQAPRTNLPY